MSTLKSVGQKLFKTELASHEVKLALLDEIEKAKADLLSRAKKHFDKRDSWGAETNKVLSMVGDLQRKGIELKKETDVLDKDLSNIYNKVSNLRKQADSLGLELPKEVDSLGGRAISSWGNSFVDTRIIVDEFKAKLK
jgi:chromosome segregation ATPase